MAIWIKCWICSAKIFGKRVLKQRCYNQLSRHRGIFMQTRQWSLQNAKNKLSAVVDAAQQGKAQVITRRGVPSAVVLSIEEFEKFQRFEAAQSPSFIDHLFSMPVSTICSVCQPMTLNLNAWMSCSGILNNVFPIGYRYSVSHTPQTARPES